MKVSRLLNFIIILFWIGQIFASVDPYLPEMQGWNVVFVFFQRLYGSDPIFGQFPGFELVVFSLLLYFIISPYYKFYKTHSILRFVFFLTIIVSVLTFLNPNNNFSVGFLKFVGHRVGRSFFIFAPIMFVIFHLKKDDYYSIIIRFFKIGLIFITIRTFFSYIAYFSGNGMQLFGRNVTVAQADILLWLTIFSIVFLADYLYTRNSRSLYFTLFFLLCNFLSFRRSALAVFIISFILLIFFYNIYVKKNIKVVFYTVITLAFLGLIIAVLVTSSNVFRDYSLRYLSAVEFTGVAEIEEVGEQGEYTDTGHLDQSVNTTKFLYENLDIFWGGGIGNRVSDGNIFWVEGRSQGGVHSNLAGLWGTYGLYMTIYLLIIFFTLIRLIFRIVRLRGITHLEFISLSCLVYLLAETIIGWFSGIGFIGNLQYETRFILLISTIKLVRFTPHKIRENSTISV